MEQGVTVAHTYLWSCICKNAMFGRNDGFVIIWFEYMAQILPVRAACIYKDGDPETPGKLG